MDALIGDILNIDGFNERCRLRIGGVAA